MSQRLHGFYVAHVHGRHARFWTPPVTFECRAYAELSAAENLLFFGRLYAVPDLAQRVDAALHRAELTNRRDDPVAGFSRGMRQRLALERALLHEPHLVLLDEPFTGLDDAATAALGRRLAVLRANGTIPLVTTHDLETIEPIVDRAVVLQNGRLAAIEPGARRTPSAFAIVMIAALATLRHYAHT